MWESPRWVTKTDVRDKILQLIATGEMDLQDDTTTGVKMTATQIINSYWDHLGGKTKPGHRRRKIYRPITRAAKSDILIIANTDDEDEVLEEAYKKAQLLLML